MGHFKQLLISEPCGEQHHEKGRRKQKGLHKKVSSSMFLLKFFALSPVSNFDTDIETDLVLSKVYLSLLSTILYAFFLPVHIVS